MSEEKDPSIYGYILLTNDIPFSGDDGSQIFNTIEDIELFVENYIYPQDLENLSIAPVGHPVKAKILPKLVIG